MDFVSDALMGRVTHFGLDDFRSIGSFKSGLEEDMSLPGVRSRAFLKDNAFKRTLSQCIKVDIGPKFSDKALSARAFDSGKPPDNGYIESFNGKFRDECLNQAAAARLIGLADTERILRTEPVPIGNH